MGGNSTKAELKLIILPRESRTIESPLIG